MARAVKSKFEEILRHAESLRLPDVLHVAVEYPTAINATDEDGRTALSLVARATRERLDACGSSLKAKWGLIDQLLRLGADPTAAAADGTTPLHWAAKANDTRTIEALITHSPLTINTKTSYHETPLVLSVQYGNEEGVALLLARGADALLGDNFRFNALHHAAKCEHLGIARLLINTPQAKALVQSHDGFGSTPLVTAAHHGHDEMVRLLLPLASWCNIKDAVHAACQVRFIEVVRAIAVVETLFEWTQQHLSRWPGASQQQDAESYRFPLAYATMAGSTDMLKLFLRFNCLMSAEGTDSQGYRAIHNAVRSLNMESVQLLVQAGESLLDNDTGGSVMEVLARRPALPSRTSEELEMARYFLRTERRLPLNNMVMICLDENKYELAKLLVEGGARLTEKDAIDILDHMWHPEEVAFLASYPYLTELVKKPFTSIARYAATSDLGLNVLKACAGYECIMSRVGGRPLDVAVKHCSVENVRFLLGLEVVLKEIDISVNDSHYGPPLLCAFKGRNDCTKRAEIASLLLAAGADPTQRLPSGDTVLEHVKHTHGHLAAFKDIIVWMNTLASMDQRVLIMHKLRALMDGRDVSACLRPRARRSLEMPEVDLHGPRRKTRWGWRPKVGVMEEEWGVLCGVVTDMCGDMYNELMAYMTPSWVEAKAAREEAAAVHVVVEMGEDGTEYIVID